MVNFDTVNNFLIKTKIQINKITFQTCKACGKLFPCCESSQIFQQDMTRQLLIKRLYVLYSCTSDFLFELKAEKKKRNI